MLSVFDRYLLREVAAALAAVLVVLTVIVTGNLFARLVSDVVEGQLAHEILLPLVALTSLRTVITLLPVALFLAVMLAVGRLYRDSEMVVLRACGVGDARLYRSLFVLAVPLAAISALLAFEAAPWTQRMGEELKAMAAGRSELVGVAPGRFIESSGGDRVLFVESVDDHRMRGVFVYGRDGERRTVATAARARHRYDADTDRRFMVLKDGQRYEGVPGRADYRVTAFHRHGVRLPDPDTEPGDLDADAMTTARLLGAQGPQADAQLQWRLSFPVSTVLLVLLALPLSRGSAQRGRFARLGAAILIYVVYANLAVVAKAWTEDGLISPALGLWWVHGALLCLIAVLHLQQHGLGWLRRRHRGRA